MPIKKGDRLIHQKTGMKCKAVSDEDGDGMVMTKQAGSAFAPCPVGDLVEDSGDIPIKSTGGIDIVARKNAMGGGYRAIIKDKNAGVEKQGMSCPGDPDDFEYNELTDSWTAKPKN